MSLGPSSTADEIIAHLRSLGSEDNLAGMARFGIVTEAALGLSNVELHKVTRQVKVDHRRALKPPPAPGTPSCTGRTRHGCARPR